VEADGSVMEYDELCDLGISRLKSVNNATATSRLGVPGTAMYMAPESILHRKSSCASDVWSLACTILELITEKEAWEIPDEDDTEDVVDFFYQKFEKRNVPDNVKSLPYKLLQTCFTIEAHGRPTAQELIPLF
jgi:serine/threonine protein kinase